jgi:polyferredoxin
MTPSTKHAESAGVLWKVAAVAFLLSFPRRFSCPVLCPSPVSLVLPEDVSFD